MTRIFLLAALLVLTGCGGARERGDDARGGLFGRAFSKAETPEGGGLCGIPGLVGEEIGAVPGNGACGIPNAISLRAVDGVQLSTPATINCETAKAFQTWVNDGARAAIGKRGGGVASLKVAASYACRTRNHQRGARLSEHSYGNAIDISEIRLADGTEITLLEGWGSKRDGAALRQMHKAACGPFGTVLGPESDRFHRDHFHFDVANHRGGPYCR